MNLLTYLIGGIGFAVLASPVMPDVCMSTSPGMRPLGQPINPNGRCWLEEMLGNHFGADGFRVSGMKVRATSDDRPLARRTYYLRRPRAELELELSRDGKSLETVLAVIAEGLPEAMCGPFKDGRPEGEIAAFVSAGGVVDYYLRIQNSPKIKTIRIDTCEAL
ncbi:hypothetical protein [Litoreibacter halocynthiae]|uniref:hypothetical protein n=1 Tax=Litoreibacter halocynthiae TaxID=1242689 RepID=UPI002490607D|nr:hypothetical protein [Litoreibacter halocynthiae]